MRSEDADSWGDFVPQANCDVDQLDLIIDNRSLEDIQQDLLYHGQLQQSQLKIPDHLLAKTCATDFGYNQPNLAYLDRYKTLSARAAQGIDVDRRAIEEMKKNLEYLMIESLNMEQSSTQSQLTQKALRLSNILNFTQADNATFLAFL